MYNVMEIYYVYSTLVKEYKQKEKRRKKPKKPPSDETNEQTHIQYIYNRRVGHSVTSLENWGVRNIRKRVHWTWIYTYMYIG